MSELPWVDEARKYIGLREIKGPRHNGTIIKWLSELGAWWRNDETPWCGVYVGHCLKASGRFVIKNWFRARDWAKAGTILDKPAYGCIVIFVRKGGGHVGFCVGKDKFGNLMILGGNQGDAVNINPFSKERVLAYIWPSRKDGTHSRPKAERYKLPVLNSDGKVSKNES